MEIQILHMLLTTVTLTAEVKIRVIDPSGKEFEEDYSIYLLQCPRGLLQRYLTFPSFRWVWVFELPHVWKLDERV